MFRPRQGAQEIGAGGHGPFIMRGTQDLYGRILLEIQATDFRRIIETENA
jgi:hypothetical protein